MALDWPAFGDALWKVSDRLGIRPEWQLPVLSLETGGTFDPAITNPGGCVGLNQFCPSAYSRYVPVPPDAYKRWSASRQLAGPIFEYWRDAEKAYGPIRSGVRLMVAQLGHALLPRTKTLDSVVFSSPSAEYNANSGLDRGNKGFITVQDLANVLARHAESKPVLDALGKAYSMRPGQWPYNLTYGTDFGYATPPEIIIPPTMMGTKSGKFGATVGALALALGAGYGAYKALPLLKPGTA